MSAEGPDLAAVRSWLKEDASRARAVGGQAWAGLKNDWRRAASRQRERESLHAAVGASRGVVLCACTVGWMDRVQ
jgi:hypothetical protein